MSQRTSGIHPNISSIIRLRDDANQLLHDHMDIDSRIQGLRHLDALMRIIEKKDRNEELHTHIINEIKFFSTNHSRTQEQNRIMTREFIYLNWFMELDDILWEKEYLLNRKYGVETKKDTTFKDVKAWNENE